MYKQRLTVLIAYIMYVRFRTAILQASLPLSQFDQPNNECDAVWYSAADECNHWQLSHYS